ncbi:plasmid recombination protein [Ruminococcus albus]|uniref:Plasmid recombination protein n=1 Tax=Ruminococcus albus (strain ATCC 27210 / DSM 20455 / JCM 14654 / NCDO 2250 / 7) TaxID=697329 RepID=E6UEY5_RUMA7|nr:plasmid recombination protein [Ruminococcus albus]ADU22984.1 plasmid recombination protein [Ruminococcus albus 7 = DSM 20455]
MSEKSISMCEGKGSLSHNNREFTAKNIDSSRTPNNIVFVQQELGEAYHQLFDEAVEKYNARQKRKDRKIGDYFEHLFNRPPGKSFIVNANKQKCFYEHLVYIGTKKDSGIGTPDAEITKECLREYMEGFQERNPNFYVFNAVMHLDESTPHLHIDYIPVGHFKNGLEVRNAKNKALEEMNFGKDAKANNRWRLAEWDVLKNICNAHDIEISEPKKSRGYSYTVEEYGEHQDRINALNAEIERLTAERDEAVAEFEKVSRKKVKLAEIDSVETGKTVFGGKVTVSQEDWENVSDLAKKEVASQKQTKKLRKERDEAVQERDKLKTQLAAVSSELSEYKKKEENKRYFSREKQNAEAQRIKREEQLTRDLQKARAFITACGLSEDFARYRYNKTRSTELE